MKQTHAEDRESSLDAARGLLLMLGIFLHAANIYSVNAAWLVTDVARHPVFDLVGNLIHVFRMPSFFLISGYFCAMVVAKRGSDAILQTRIPRLLIPLITVLLLVNAPQFAILTWLRHDDPWSAMLNGPPLYHLWFLADLAIVTLLFGSSGPRIARLFVHLQVSHLIPLIALLALLTYVLSFATRATGIAYETWYGITNLYRLSQYLPYFLVGLAMFHNNRIRLVFLQIPTIAMIFSIPGAYYLSSISRGRLSFSLEMATVGEILLTWVSVATLLNFFTYWFSRGNSFTRFFSTSAYTIFLFHHPIVVIMGILLLPFDWGPWIKYLLVCGVSASVAALIHVYFVGRYGWASKLFNGK